MKRVCLLASLLAAAAGTVCADSTTTLTCNQTGAENSLIPTGDLQTNSSLYGFGCFTNQFVNATAWDSLDWGSTTAPGGLGPAVTDGTPLSVSTSLAVDARTSAGLGVDLQLAPDYSGTANAVVRADNTALVWAASPKAGPARWVIPGSQNTPTDLSLDAGHFDAPGPTGPPVQGAGYGYPYGDHLVELQNGGPLELMFLGSSVFGVWFQISSLEGIDSNFNATVEALDSNKNVLGTYSIQAGGSGGGCLSLSSNMSRPTPCNDAPYIGFYDPQGRIHSVYISAIDPSTNNLIGFAIDTLRVDEVPEPSMPLLVGGGLAAFCLWRRWRLTQSR